LGPLPFVCVDEGGDDPFRGDDGRRLGRGHSGDVPDGGVGRVEQSLDLPVAPEAFVQHDDTELLDASLLLMPLVHFIAPTDPRWLSRLDAIGEELVRDSMVYRYDPAARSDGIESYEGAFSMCTFWHVECLARAGRLEEAQLLFEKMHTYANHLGLYSEQIGLTGELLGNFPQAFTHLALISAAFNLNRQLSGEPTLASSLPSQEATCCWGDQAPNNAEHRRWLVLVVLCFSVLVIVLDNTVLNEALPSIVRQLGGIEEPAAVDG
jgi:hypothetical protein